MRKKRRAAAERQPQPRKSKVSWPAIAFFILLVLILVIVLTMNPSKRTTTEKQPVEVSSTLPAYEFQKQGELSFLSTKRGLITTINIEIARDESQRELGLMYRERMAENQGMLFIFDRESPQSFWMKNTIISLDILFVDGKNQIVTIHQYTTPYSEESYASTKPAQYVVEVKAGFTDKYGIAVGDRIAWTAF